MMTARNRTDCGPWGARAVRYAVLVAAIWAACAQSTPQKQELDGALCLTHNGTDCDCPLGAACHPCSDSIDNDGDGWSDGQDPDCSADQPGELGIGSASCNDGLDGDGDGRVDGDDPQCQAALDHEVLGADACTDVCLYDDQRDDGASCALWNNGIQGWGELDPNSLHDRARAYAMWLRRFMLPAGGVASTLFQDTSYTVPVFYTDQGDSAIWTGTYLASEALRAMVTGAPDALQQVERSVNVLHDWLHVTGAPGYLARYAAPVGDDAIVDASIIYGRLTPYKGRSWRYVDDTSRDQYQGVMLGLALAYEATDNTALRKLIRDDVLGVVEQLMKRETRTTRVVISGLTLLIDIDYQYTVFNPQETEGGIPEIYIEGSDPEDIRIAGFQEFHPYVTDIYRQVPGFGWLPKNLPRAGSAIMVGSFFRVAMELTRDQPGYEERHQAISDFYYSNVGRWLSAAEKWTYTGECGDGYFGTHIVQQPMFNWTRLVSEPGLRAVLRTDLLHEQMWPMFQDHKNVLYAYFYAANAPDGVDTSGLVAEHTAQLRLFPSPPRVNLPYDLTAQFVEDGDCPGNATEAIDLNLRPAEDYIWQRHPWRLTFWGDPNRLFPGVDYLFAYWLGRHQGFIDDDAENTCLRWRDPG